MGAYITTKLKIEGFGEKAGRLVEELYDQFHKFLANPTDDTYDAVVRAAGDVLAYRKRLDAERDEFRADHGGSPPSSEFGGDPKSPMDIG